MSDIAIAVENLGKSYRIGHHAAESERYTALRDVIARNAKNFVRKTRDLIKGNAIVEGDQVEEFWALKDVSFEVKQGECVGIIGRNGAGKSTLLKILSGITAPTTGRIGVAGRVASLLEVGTGFHPELTGRENIYLNGTILGMSRKEIRRKFDEIVAFAEVEQFLDTPVKRYSSGMYVRLAFAVAAHLEPEILVVDEVLAVGDAQFQKKCLGKMEDVASQGRTVLFVSHNMAAVRSLCQTAVLLEKGTLEFAGSIAASIERYLAAHCEIQTCDVQLNDCYRPAGLGRQLRLSRLRVNRGQAIYYGEPLIVDVHFEAHSDVTGVSFGLGFCSPSGERVLTIDSDIPGIRRDFSNGTKGVASFVLKEFYAEPGLYALEVGARSGDSYGLDYLSPAGVVLVAPSADTPAVIALRSGRTGGVRPPTKWSFTQENNG